MFKDNKDGSTHSMPPRGAKAMGGERYGRLLVTPDWLPPRKKGQTYQWLCICECGKETYVTRDHLKSGMVKSCGCLSTEVHRDMKRKAIGPLNHNWTGDNVSCDGVHLWIHRHKPKTGVCEICGKRKRLDAANVSGKYKRDINDFRWLCRRCHMESDGRLNKLAETQIKKHPLSDAPKEKDCNECAFEKKGGLGNFDLHTCMKEKSKRQKRYEALINEFEENGFTKQQATYLINLLDDFIPII